MYGRWKLVGIMGISVMLVTVGATIGALAMVRMQPYPWPSQIQETNGTGSYLKIAWYPSRQFPPSEKDGGLAVVEFRDYQDGRMLAKARVRGPFDGEARIMYDNSREIVARIGSHKVIVCDKKTRRLTRYDFSENYKLLTLTDDQKYFIAEDRNDAKKLFLLNWSGAIIAQVEKTSAGISEWTVLQEEFVFLTSLTEGPPTGIYTWDIRNNKITEDMRSVIKKFLARNAAQYNLFQPEPGKLLLQASFSKDADIEQVDLR